MQCNLQRYNVMESGDECTICQEKYCQPIKLRCKHVFCEAGGCTRSIQLTKSVCVCVR
jgi:hypothetical protein